MPAYDYHCPSCSWSGELLQVPYENRHKQRCPDCKKRLKLDIGFAAIGPEPFQTKAVLSNGAHVKGHFGKEAKRRRKK